MSLRRLGLFFIVEIFKQQVIRYKFSIVAAVSFAIFLCFRSENVSFYFWIKLFAFHRISWVLKKLYFLISVCIKNTGFPFGFIKNDYSRFSSQLHKIWPAWSSGQRAKNFKCRLGFESRPERSLFAYSFFRLFVKLIAFSIFYFCLWYLKKKDFTKVL